MSRSASLVLSFGTVVFASTSGGAHLWCNVAGMRLLQSWRRALDFMCALHVLPDSSCTTVLVVAARCASALVRSLFVCPRQRYQ